MRASRTQGTRPHARSAPPRPKPSRPPGCVPLQIIADDVKCTHGCTVSDLRDEELFYFRTRGIDAETARRALVVSFGAEVMQHLGHAALLKRMQGAVSETLLQADIGAVDGGTVDA
eukprot:360484-Chlamydomonas_euryale.AAC.10